MDNQQIIVEHIVNIDTVAQHIDTVDAVAGVSGKIAAVAGMLPDVAATAQSRSVILALSKKLTEITAVSEALPLLSALQDMTAQVTAVIALRPELAAVVGQMSAIQGLAAELEILVQAPQHAESARFDAERATAAAGQAENFAGKSDAARLGAEFAENEARAAADRAGESAADAEQSAGNAQQAADAASAVSGLPDASFSLPGDPLIWDGTAFAVGKLAESLLSTNDTLAVAPAVLDDISAARAEAASATAAAGQASAVADAAGELASGVDAKATQAVAQAAEANSTAESAAALAGSFDTRLAAAERETLNVGLGLGGHTADANIHTPLSGIESVAEAAVNRLRDGGDGTNLPADRATLLALSQLLDTSRMDLSTFLHGSEPGQRIAILTEMGRLAAEVANALTRADVVNDLDTGGQDVPLSAEQGRVLKQEVDGVGNSVSAALRPWITTVTTLPAEWPEYVQPGGLLLHFPLPDATTGQILNPQWYTNVRGVPLELVLDAVGVRLSDGTTVQSAVGQMKVDSAEIRAAAQTAEKAATQAAANAETATASATSALNTAQAVDGKATQAQADAATALSTAQAVDGKATQAQTDAATALTTAQAVDGKATAAQSAAEAAETKATEAHAVAEAAEAKAVEALAKTPELATQTTPGIVKGSGTVTVGADGSLNVVGGGGGGGGIATFVGQWLLMRQNPLPAGFLALDGTLHTGAAAKLPDLIAYLTARENECTTEADWQARSAAASGTGGVPFYVYDSAADTLRMPDTRGDSPYHGTPGTWQGDAIRNITGTVGENATGRRTLTISSGGQHVTGAFSLNVGTTGLGQSGNVLFGGGFSLDASLVVPTDTTNHPRRIGLTWAVYAGTTIGV